MDTLGFTISEAMEISESITGEYNMRFNASKEYAQAKAREFADEVIRNTEAHEADRAELEMKSACYHHYGNSDSLLSFTLNELSSFSGHEMKTCKRYLQRMSQRFGYRNPRFPHTFQYPFSAPWDYNTLYERPIIHHEDKYFAAMPSLFATVLFNTFHYDLISDPIYRDEYDRKRGKWLETKTADCLKWIFPHNEVLLNPEYPNGEEFSDVLVLHDRKIFIVQCKSKRLKHESKIGESLETIKDDLRKGVEEAFDQAAKARDYLNNGSNPEIITDCGRLAIDRNQVTHIFLVSVTLTGYQDLTTRFANLDPDLGLFSDGEYPWAISLSDLEVVCELIDYPSVFIHYAKRRIQVEKTNFEITADETDLLCMYIHQGLLFDIDQFKDVNSVGLSGLSPDIDQFMFEKYELGRAVSKPKPEMPPGFEDYIVEIESLQVPYRTDCAMRLLDLDHETRETFVSLAEQIKERTRKDRGLHSFSMGIRGNRFGISFIAMDAGGDMEKLSWQSAGFAMMKKHKVKCKEWVGFGWDRSSQRKVDIAIFLSNDPFDDPVLDKLVEEKLKAGEIVEVKGGTMPKQGGQ